MQQNNSKLTGDKNEAIKVSRHFSLEDLYKSPLECLEANLKNGKHINKKPHIDFIRMSKHGFCMCVRVCKRQFNLNTSNIPRPAGCQINKMIFTLFFSYFSEEKKHFHCE